MARRRMYGSQTARISMALIDARVDAVVLQRVLQRQGVLHGGHHADVVAGGAVHAAGGGGHAAEDVAAADNDGDVDVEAAGDLDGLGEALGGRGVDRPRLAAQRLAAQLEKDAVEGAG